MSEYIVRETGYPGAIKQEIVGELVRCGECKYWDEESTFCLNIEGCYGNETTPNWYCADGVRREE